MHICTLGLPHCARPSLSTLLAPSSQTCPHLACLCTLHLAPCYHPTSFLPFAVCWLCVDVINVRVRVCLREHERGVELISKFHIRTHPYPYHSQQYPAPAPQPMLPNNCQW